MYQRRLWRWRAFIAGIVSRHNAGIDAERTVLKPLPAQRAQDFELERVRVTAHSGFTQRRCSTRCHRG